MTTANSATTCSVCAKTIGVDADQNVEGTRAVIANAVEGESAQCSFCENYVCPGCMVGTLCKDDAATLEKALIRRWPSATWAGNGELTEFKSPYEDATQRVVATMAEIHAAMQRIVPRHLRFRFEADTAIMIDSDATVIAEDTGSAYLLGQDGLESAPLSPYGKVADDFGTVDWDAIDDADAIYCRTIEAVLQSRIVVTSPEGHVEIATLEQIASEAACDVSVADVVTTILRRHTHGHGAHNPHRTHQLYSEEGTWQYRVFCPFHQ